MSLSKKIKNIYSNLGNILKDINMALLEKGYEGQISNLSEISNCIKNLKTGFTDELFLSRINGNLTSVTTLPDTMTKIGKFSFAECNNLQTIILPRDLKTIGEYAFYNSSRNMNVYISDPSQLANMTIEDYTASPFFGPNVHNSLSSTKQNNARLYLRDSGVLVENLEFSSDITQIKDYTFRGCTSIQTLIVPDTVTSIGRGAFEYCYFLRKVTLGNGVQNIDLSVFSDCINLTDIYLHSIIPPTLQSTSAISNATTAIHVPVGSGEAYRTATNWSNFADIIIEDITI